MLLGISVTSTMKLLKKKKRLTGAPSSGYPLVNEISPENASCKLDLRVKRGKHAVRKKVNYDDQVPRGDEGQLGSSARTNKNHQGK